ncbi:carbohydrate esterase family 16 protein [Collybiopsis luxurians FD-317 M1]|uniref:Carbohydrate esterase family 16 protein n=1 Tax=Collybiopsis luxurians FD-317 M1 TaxID=944289 RepID=A0A0D0C3R3_9AGAR|nr:carbohydrate esterase family 16 protein [Collybiopsis luxurians FD-317 M1]
MVKLALTALHLYGIVLSANLALAEFSWGDTKFLFTFGDSYTTDGYNISAGIDSPDPGFTSSNGPNWVEFLGGTYNVTDTKVFNLASGGATIDAALVPPFLPTVLSVVDQVSQFQQFLAPKPTGAKWSSSDSLFAIWIGINDVGNSFPWTNISQPIFYEKLMARLTSQVDILYDSGARSFVFLTVPPTDRAPLQIEQGPEVVARFKGFLADYNNLLSATVRNFTQHHSDVELAMVFDTRPIFNTLLDNSQTFGFVNVTGYCEAYENGTADMTTQVAGCAPVSSYFWLNSLHPLFTVHNILAHALSTALST